MSKYFKESEFACKCGNCSGLPPGGMNLKLLNLLDSIREVVGQPVHVTSGYRCPDHNEAIGGVRNSFHTHGAAADIYSEGIGIDELADIARRAGADGVGRYYGQGFVHVDVRGYKSDWEE